MAAAPTAMCRFDEIEKMLTEAPSRGELLASPTFMSLLKARIDALLPRGGILSLDVFDTVLLRDCSSELTRFFEIGGLLAAIVNDQTAKPPIRDVDAFAARYLATKASYRASDAVEGCREGALDEIHVTTSRLLTGDSALAARFIDAELDYEAKRLTRNETLLDLARSYRALGARLILVSDTYMRREDIEALLVRAGIDVALFDSIVSSADTKVSKGSGKVFALIEDYMKSPSAAFLHVGDDLRGDFRRPKERGWQALHLPIPRSEIRERRRQHFATAKQLEADYGLSTDVAAPGG
jgi:FMN phosphatase YigB (HAD superfamily)